jgi:hypothetical protein
MATKTLTVELPEDFYIEFIDTVTKKGGLWRSKRKKETFTSALESAVTAALMLFLQNLTEGPVELPEFREYVCEKYPQLDEDLITKIENLIEILRYRSRKYLGLSPEQFIK